MNFSTASPAPSRPESGGPSPHRTGSSAVDVDGRRDTAHPGRSRRRTAAVTLLWWLHGAARIYLAIALFGYGAAKVALMQFGQADMGDALVAAGQMSPMGLLWRMVAYSTLFQLLAGMAEVGAAAALLWRRTVPLGALLGLADMTFVFVLNLGYDVPVKQPSLLYAVVSLLILTPWIPRLWRAVLGRRAVPAGPWPRLLPWRRADRVVGALAAGVAILAAIGTLAVLPFIAPKPTQDLAAPVGVWSVQHDARPAPAQLAEDTRIQQMAFGQWSYASGDEPEVRRASVRLADGEVLEGSYRRTGTSTVHVELRPQRSPGQEREAWERTTPRVLDLEITENADGTLHVTGGGEDLQLARDADGSVLYDRGFSWEVRPDDPFNR